MKKPIDLEEVEQFCKKQNKKEYYRYYGANSSNVPLRFEPIYDDDGEEIGEDPIYKVDIDTEDWHKGRKEFSVDESRIPLTTCERKRFRFLTSVCPSCYFIRRCDLNTHTRQDEDKYSHPWPMKCLNKEKSDNFDAGLIRNKVRKCSHK